MQARGSQCLVREKAVVVQNGQEGLEQGGGILHTTVSDQQKCTDQGTLWNGWVLMTLLISDIPSGFISGPHLIGTL